MSDYTPNGEHVIQTGDHITSTQLPEDLKMNEFSHNENQNNPDAQKEKINSEEEFMPNLTAQSETDGTTTEKSENESCSGDDSSCNEVPQNETKEEEKEEQKSGDEGRPSELKHPMVVYVVAYCAIFFFLMMTAIVAIAQCKIGRDINKLAEEVTRLRKTVENQEEWNANIINTLDNTNSKLGDISNELARSAVEGHGWLGVTIANGSADNGNDTISGPCIVNIAEGSAADIAGLKKNDMITKIDDTDIHSVLELTTYLNKTIPGDVVTLYVLSNRGVEPVPVIVTLTEKPENLEEMTGNSGVWVPVEDSENGYVEQFIPKEEIKDDELKNDRARRKADTSLGINVVNGSVEGYADVVSGAEISYIEPECNAEKCGLCEGDIIVSVNGERIESANEFKRATNFIIPGSSVSIKTVRVEEGQYVYTDYEITADER